MTEPTEAEVEAMAKVIGDKAVELARGKWEIEWPWLRDPDSNAAVDLRELARAALTAAAQVRERARRENCRHPRKQGTGSLASDGSSHSTWSCPDCGASGTTSTPPRADGEGFRAMLVNATEPDSGPSVLGNEE